MNPATAEQWAAFFSRYVKKFKRTNSKQAEGLCPFHDDQRPSFSMNLEQGLWDCHAGCGGGNGLTFADKLALSRNDVPGWISVEEFGNDWDEIYPYKDERWQLLYQLLRYPGKKFRFRRPGSNNDWIWHLDDTRRVLYRLPELLEAKKNEAAIFIVEGEKDVETLRKYGLTATCNPTGAGKWRDEYSESLKGFLEVIIIADKDKEGRLHAQQVAESVSKVVNRVKVVELPGNEVKDATDYFETGGTSKGLMDEVQAAPLWRPSQDTNSTNTTNSDSSDSCNSYISYTVTESQLPAALMQEAFYGLAGEIVNALDPYTEADPAGVLITLLGMVGNVVGSRPHFNVNGDPHALKLFLALTGSTGNGRKGSSAGQPKRLIAHNDPKWVDKRIQGGLSTGEGLIWAVHDPVFQKQPIKDKKTGQVSDYQRVMIDEGVEDKRLLVIEEEFSRTLKAMARDGNTLSEVIRKAWDGSHLQTLTKGNPYESNGAHVSIIAHITKDELLRRFDSTEAANGFGNRFLWVVVNRSKLLPRGKSPSLDVLQPLQMALSRCISFGATLDEITRTDEAEEYWDAVYSVLSEERPGLFGAMTARAAPQVMRLACIYAILDMSSQIKPVHLKAALAVWRRVEDSVRFIWGQRLGDPIADEILEALRAEGQKTLTQIHAIFKRNQPAERIRAALSLLRRYHLAKFGKNKSGAEVWVYIDPTNGAPPRGTGGGESV